jgi:phosphate transport system protein
LARIAGDIKMTREYLDQLINHLLDEVLILESMVREAILESVKSLMTQDKKLSKIVSKNDENINVKRFEIENECLITIATQQPMASDLRILASILEIITELERIGDYAKGIAKITRKTKGEDILPPLEYLPDMANEAVDMMQKAVKAFVEGDIKTARAIPERDDIVDNNFNQIYRGLIKFMSKNPEKAEVANHLLWAAHNLERMADRVTNICERTLFIETGSIYELEELDSDDDDDFHTVN